MARPPLPRIPHPDNQLDLPYKWVALTQGQYSKVAADLFDRINVYWWCARWEACTKSFYAARAVRRTDGTRAIQRLHNFICELRGIVIPEGFTVDHKSRATLDNTDGNLRLATRSQQIRNRHTTNASGVSGVHRHQGKWRAQIRSGGKQVEIGKFTILQDASDAVTLARFLVDPVFYGVSEPNVSDAIRARVTSVLRAA